MSMHSVPQHTGFAKGSFTFSMSCGFTSHTSCNSVYDRAAGTALRCVCFHDTSDLLWTGQSGDRIPVEAKFSAPVQTVPGAHQPPIPWVPGLSRG